MEYKKHHNRIFGHWFAGLFVWMPLLVMLLLDLVIEIYHRVCFPIYGLPYVKRSKYIIFDRQKLSYLRWYDKIYCTYCAYANGVLPFTAAIAKETERYWCAIKHQPGSNYALAAEDLGYIEYGDQKAYEELVQKSKNS
jgi:hypothetical protein